MCWDWLKCGNGGKGGLMGLGGCFGGRGGLFNCSGLWIGYGNKGRGLCWWEKCNWVKWGNLRVWKCVNCVGWVWVCKRAVDRLDCGSW